MALIKNGSINDFSVGTIVPQKRYEDINTFAALDQVSVNAPDFKLITSNDQRGIGLKSIFLKENFDGFLDGVNELYFMAYAYDLSGRPVVQFPMEGVPPSDVLIPIRAGKIRQFIGEGISLFPKSLVTGGVALKIHIFESDADIRRFGEILSSIAARVQESQLNSVLALISMATGITGVTIDLIKNAALELTKVIGATLQSNTDDYVDGFEGYYASDQQWIIGDDMYAGNATAITLEKY